jgi:hypothetical protein
MAKPKFLDFCLTFKEGMGEDCKDRVMVRKLEKK